MNSEAQDYIRRHILVQMEKYPDINVKDMKKWLLAGEQPWDLREVNAYTLRAFIRRNMEKFEDTGSLDRKTGSGRPRSARTAENVRKIKCLSLNKLRRGNQTVAAMVGTSRQTVQRTLKGVGARFYHRRKVQSMTPEHERRRVLSIQIFLQ